VIQNSAAHRIYVGHRRQQEEEQLGKFEYEFLHRLLGLVHHPALRVAVTDHRPDDAGAENDGFRLAKAGVLFGDYERVGEDKYDYRGETYPLSS
jgi:hypothetical protein